MQVTVFAPEKGVIEAVTPPYRAFKAANDFLIAFGKKPILTWNMLALRNLYRRTKVNTR